MKFINHPCHIEVQKAGSEQPQYVHPGPGILSYKTHDGFFDHIVVHVAYHQPFKG